MLEKYFILGVFAASFLCITALFGGLIVWLRLQHLKKLAQLNMLRRQQFLSGNRFFSTYFINSAVCKLFWRFSGKARPALAALAGGRPQKAAEYFKNADRQLSLFLQAHYEKPEPLYKKLRDRRKKIKKASEILAAADMARLLFFNNEIPLWLKRLKGKKAPLALKAEQFYLSALVYLQEGDMLSASEQASLALKFFKSKHYVYEEAQTYLLLAEIYRISCVNDIAQTMLESALKIYNEAKLPFFKAQATAMLGMLMLFENRLEEAEDKFDNALKIYNNSLFNADVLNQKALLQLAQKNEKEALKTAKSALTLHQKALNERGIAFSRQLIGHFLLNAGFFEKAAAEANKAAKIYLQQQNFSARAESLYLQAKALSQLTKYDKAEKILRQILAESKQHDLNFHIANAYSLLGLIYLQKQDLSRAKVLLQQSLHLEQNHNRCNGLAADYANLALVEKLSGDKHAAEESFKAALEYAQKTEDETLIELVKNADNNK